MTATWWILGVLAAAVIAFAVREVLIGGTGWLARHIIILAVRRLPEGRRELRREEWLAEHDTIVAKGLHIRGVIHAGGTYVGAVRMAPSRQGAATLKRILSAAHPSAEGTDAAIAAGIVMGLTLLVLEMDIQSHVRDIRSHKH